ncbi:hypothetical protein VUR80DRAFT_10265 [Thermomyces stellatus]
MMALPNSFLGPWLHTLSSHSAEHAGDLPPPPADPRALVSTSSPLTLRSGSGASIYTSSLLPALSSARREIILVTCFWAPSDSLTSIRQALETLARRRIDQIADGDDPPTLKIQICFSSRSPWQKLFHTWSRRGHVYPPREWRGLGLPAEDLLQEARVDMRVKSLFFLPFSVMHPKFLVVDGRRAWMPSCNVSWETWFEGCVEFHGPAVDVLLGFYEAVWEPGEAPRPKASHTANGPSGDAREEEEEAPPTLHFRGNPSRRVFRFPRNPAPSLPTVILPSSHHRNPRFNPILPFLPIPFLKEPPPPATPLNAALLTLFANARRTIRILTPNLTCRAVEAALLDALSRGVDVSVLTSENMMVAEQLVTALTTTSRRVKALIRAYERLCRRLGGDLESGRRVGALEIRYYRPDPQGGMGEPVVSHVKMVRVDGEFTVLGSGNMDRASWYTSQELGVLFYGGEGWDLLEEPLRTRTEVVFPR